MTDRDAFAAAALAGLLAQGDDGSFSEESYARGAYRWADVMLRERERTIHDAAPAATARTDADRNRTDKAALRPGEGTGGTQEPVAWAVVSDSKEEIDCKFIYPDEATAGDVALDSNGGVVPLYRSPTLTDAEREAVEDAIRRLWGFDIAATLRGLLERMK